MAARRLGQLNAAVTSGTHADVWERLDLRRVIDAEMIAEQLHRIDDRVAAAIAVCEWARNILILAPIVITWLGLSGALKAYEAAVTADGQLAQQSFLLLWQQGFGGRLGPGHELSAVAMNVALSIGLVILLTAVSHGFDNLVQRRQEYQRARTRVQIESLLGDAALALASSSSSRDLQRHDALARPLSGIEEFSNKLDQQRADFEKFGNQFQGELRQQLNAFNVEAGRLVGHLGSEVDRVRTYAEDLSSAVRDLKAFAQYLVEAVGDLGTLVSRGEQSATAVASSVTSLDSWVRQLQEGQVRLTAAATGLVGMAEQLLREQSQLAGDLRTAVDQQRTAARTFIESASRLEAVGHALAGSQVDMLDGLRDGAGTLAGSSQILESVLAPLPAALDTHLTALTTASEQQASASTAMQQAFVDLRRLLDRQESQVEQLRLLDQTLRNLGEAVTQLGRETQELVAGDRAAVEAQNGVLANLTQALRDVSQSATAVTSERRLVIERLAEEQRSRTITTEALQGLAASLQDALRQFGQGTPHLGQPALHLKQPETLHLSSESRETVSGPAAERPTESLRWASEPRD